MGLYDCILKVSAMKYVLFVLHYTLERNEYVKLKNNISLLYFALYLLSDHVKEVNLLL